VEKAGSRQIALRQDIKSYDFGFPAGVPAADKLMQALGQKQSFQTFFTPMVIASWKPIADLLVAQGMARAEAGGYYILDMNRLLETMQRGARWKQLPGNSVYPVNKSILVSSTDIRKSNSAAMYLALARYLANGSNVVQSEAEVQRVLPAVTELFLRAEPVPCRARPRRGADAGAARPLDHLPHRAGAACRAQGVHAADPAGGR
jgi:hypothetical protein